MTHAELADRILTDLMLRGDLNNNERWALGFAQGVLSREPEPAVTVVDDYVVRTTRVVGCSST